MYSNKQMNVLKKEHGFLAYLDETFAEPDEIMHALLAGAMSTKSLGGELVIEFLSTRESNDSRKQSSCFFYTYKNASFKYTSQVSRYSGEIGTVTDEISPAKILKPGSDPRVKDQLTETIEKADSSIAKLVPEVDAIYWPK